MTKPNEAFLAATKEAGVNPISEHEQEKANVLIYLAAMKLAGYVPSSMDYGDGNVDYSEETLFDVDDARVFFDQPAKITGNHELSAPGRVVGWLYFVFGNSPEEVLTDYTTNLEPALAPINAVIWHD